MVDKEEGKTSPSGAGASGGAEGSRSVKGSRETDVLDVESSGGAYNSIGPRISGEAEVSRFAGGSGDGSSRLESSRSIQFQGSRGTLLSPVVSQPGRPLPNVPKDEEEEGQKE